jgi:mRNA-degrading endonuclease toxin of MazEF toxin-antitoxin module
MVAKASLTKRAGQLAPARLIEVKRAVGAALGWRELTDLD